MMRLDDREWQTFYIGDLFTVKRPVARNKDNYQEGTVPFVASGGVNNGVMKCCQPIKDEILDDAGCITVSPVDGSAFYQPYPFLGRGGAGSSILMLYKDGMNLYIGQFIARMVANTCVGKYKYGHMGSNDSIMRERILLPVNDAGNPDYDFMEQYMKEHRQPLLNEYIAFAKKQLSGMTYKPVKKLEECEWKEFKIGDIFQVDGTITTRPEALVSGGSVPRITCSSVNNGLDNTYQNSATEAGGVLTIDSATVGSVNYQPTDFIATDHVEKVSFEGEHMNQYIGMFLACAIRHSSGSKYNYGYKFSQLRIKRQTVLLPVTPAGQPDYEYMEQYVKNIMIIKIQEYLNFASKSI